MNPITCGMAADLLPLYLDGCCSADSRAALEAHMDACPACRAQYAQLRRDLTPAADTEQDRGTDAIACALARKMRRRKRCLYSGVSAAYYRYIICVCCKQILVISDFNKGLKVPSFNVFSGRLYPATEKIKRNPPPTEAVDILI